MEVVAIGESMVALVNEPSGFIRHTDTFKPFVAGAETNTLVGLSRLGHHTKWLSAVGDDELGEFILHKMRAENLDTTSVQKKDYKTGVFFKQIFPNGNVDVTYYRENSAASKMTLEDIDIEAIKKAKILYLTGITLSLSNEIKEMIFEVVRNIESEVKVVFDPNIRLKMWSEKEARKVILSFLPLVDYLIVGKKEVEILLRHQNLSQALHEFKTLGCQNTIIKLGESGALYKIDEENGTVANPKQFTEIDPVGAGDAFAAGVVSGILKGERPSILIQKACFLGGYITQFDGDYQGFPSEHILNSALITSNDEKVNR